MASVQFIVKVLEAYEELMRRPTGVYIDDFPIPVEKKVQMLAWKSTSVMTAGDNVISALEFISAQIAEVYNK